MIRPELSIVMPTFNRRRILARTLPPLLDQPGAAGRYEIVVVVDGSTDGSAELLEALATEHPALRPFVQPENRGQSTARNRGVKEARGRILLFLDDDMVAARDLISVHLQEHSASGERVVLGEMGLADGTRRSFLKQGVADWGREMSERLSAPGYRFRFDDWHSGHASVDRSLFERVGGFDETFVRYGNEDYHLGWRLIQAGAEIRFCPKARAWQIYEKSLYDWLRDSYSVGRADVALTAKAPGLQEFLRLSREESHPLKRVARTSALLPLDPLRPAWECIAAALGTAEVLGLRGKLLSHGQSLLGEHEYWRGVRDAREAKA